jgi:hypothetical protein
MSGDQRGLVAVYVAGFDICAARKEELHHGKTLGNMGDDSSESRESRSVGGPHERCTIILEMEVFLEIQQKCSGRLAAYPNLRETPASSH